MSQIVRTKPKLVMDWCKPFQIKPQTIVTWIRYATNWFSSNDFGIIMFHWVFLNCRVMNIQQWWAPFNSPHTILWTFNPWKVKTNASSLIIPLDLLTWTFEPMNPFNVALTLGQEKFTWSCLCESPFDLKVILAFCFVDPRTYWPSKWGILIMKEDFLVYLTMVLAICDRSLDWFDHCDFNSSLTRPFLHLPPFKYTL
jgi:hypothetical protein